MALSNFQLDDLFKHDNMYGGCFAKDALPKKIGFDRFYIVNLDDSTGPGTHWAAIINCISDYCIYFDSYGVAPPESVQTFMKTSGKYCLYSSQQLQPLDSDTCGYWCVYMITMMRHGNKFLDLISSFGKNYKKNDEKMMRQLQQKGSGLMDYILRFFTGSKPRDNFPPDVRAMLSKFGDIQVDMMFVCRDPIDSVLAKALDWLSLGTFSSNMRKMKYDEMFHLYLMIRLQNRMWFRLEKNHVISLRTTTPVIDSDARKKQITGTFTTLNKMLVKAVAFRGPDFFKYDSVRANCQDFVLSVLKANNLNFDEQFILQEAEKVVPSYLEFFNRKVTDLASAVDVGLYGYGVK